MLPPLLTLSIHMLGKQAYVCVVEAMCYLPHKGKEKELGDNHAAAEAAENKKGGRFQIWMDNWQRERE